MIAALLHPSGGLGYHFRAWRYRRTLWAPMLDGVAAWLDAWHPPTDRLVLIGPSAGHTLARPFLERFDRITVQEPDPLARRLLDWRLGHRRLRFEAPDALASPAGLARLGKRHAGAAILFCNVLGQVPAPGPGRWSGQLGEALPGHHWASYHDVISTRVPPRHTGQVRPATPEPLENTLARYWHGGELELVDHETFRLGGDAEHAYLVWRITPADYHLIEWAVHAPRPPQPTA